MAAAHSNRPQAASCRLQTTLFSMLSPRSEPATHRPPLPTPSQQRLRQSVNEQPLRLEEAEISGWSKEENAGKTVLYLAYGSNLCYESFQGSRGIKPLAQLNVLVPELRLTFDLPGIPYTEPCFANSGLRVPSQDAAEAVVSEKTPLVGKAGYHKNRWTKGLVGVVYEVTLADYAHIISTEGGGTSYEDVLVDCYALTDPHVVPGHPTSKPFKAHTLFAPAAVPPKRGNPPAKNGGRFQRPDPCYAQPSARYLKLITDGAGEHSLPRDYKEYLGGLRPYTITTKRQRLGQFIFLSLWMPLIMLLLSLQKIFRDDKGRSHKWVAALTDVILKAVWISYDTLFKQLFGDGERTIEKEDDEKQR